MKQRTVAISSTEAEYMALSKCTKEVIYLRNFLIEFGLDYLANISIFSDNLGAQKLANNPSFYARTKHINIRHHFIRYIYFGERLAKAELPKIRSYRRDGCWLPHQNSYTTKLVLKNNSASSFLVDTFLYLERECWIFNSPAIGRTHAEHYADYTTLLYTYHAFAYHSISFYYSLLCTHYILSLRELYY